MTLVGQADRKISEIAAALAHHERIRMDWQALKSPHIVGLFCPYSRSLLTLVWSLMDAVASQAVSLHSLVLQGMQVLREVVAAEEEESMREQEGKTELEMERGRLATLRQSVEEERRLRNVALQTVFV